MALRRDGLMEADRSRSGLPRAEGGATVSALVARAKTNLVGQTKAMRSIRERIETLAAYEHVPVLFVGEPGTGKELAARSLHELATPDGPFVKVRCDGTSDGSSDADLLARAKGGTVFFSCVEQASDAMQSLLHRTLDAQRIADPEARVRILAAARGAHPDDVALGPELLARIAGFTLTVPPLRDRRGDIAMLADYMLESFHHTHATPLKRFTSGAVAALRKCTWPGNVRQLRAVVEASAILTPQQDIERSVIEECINNVPSFDQSRATPVPPMGNMPASLAAPDFPSLRDMERALILSAWTQQQNNLSRTANHLGIPRSTLRDKLRRFGVL